MDPGYCDVKMLVYKQTQYMIPQISYSTINFT